VRASWDWISYTKLSLVLQFSVGTIRFSSSNQLRTKRNSVMGGRGSA
jgi:hypothetical protein